MRLLFSFDFKNYSPDWEKNYRPSARGIIQHKGKYALVYSKQLKYYKFPGGGIHNNEEKTAALIREVKEETGLCVIPSSIKEFGYVYRAQNSDKKENTCFVQENYYYTCDTEDTIESQNLDDYEAEEGFELQFVSLEEAVAVNKAFTSDNAFNLVMVARDTEVMELLQKKVPEPSEAFAEYILEEGWKKNPGPWKDHSYSVARSARKIARAVNEKGGSMDESRAYVYGLLHDMGRQEGYTYMIHVLDGYNFVKAFGYENAARICLTHSFNNKVLDDYIGKKDVTQEQLDTIKLLISSIEYDDYDLLIQVLDGTCGADGTLDLELRMSDVKRRYGAYPQSKWDRNFEIKAYFEKLMNRNYYEVIRS